MHVALERAGRAGGIRLVGVWADTGISTGQVADENAPVGRVILDWTRG